MKKIDQGKVVIEKDGTGFLIMLPTGDVLYAPKEKQALKAARSFFRRTLGKADIGIGKIEWRGHVPESERKAEEGGAQ